MSAVNTWALSVAVVLAVVSVAVLVLARRSIRRHDEPRADLPTGERVVQRIVEAHDLGLVPVEDGDVDSYSALERSIQLADGRRERGSVSAIAIGAHEAAHLLQHATGYRPFRIWWVLVIPALLADVAFLCLVPWMLVFDWPALTYAAGVLLTVIAIAGVVSVVVEIDASRRAVRELRAQGIPEPDLKASRRLLVACAATYVSEAVFDVGYVGRRWARDDDGVGGESGGGDSGGDWGGGGGGDGGGGGGG